MGTVIKTKVQNRGNLYLRCEILVLRINLNTSSWTPYLTSSRKMDFQTLSDSQESALGFSGADWPADGVIDDSSPSTYL